MRESGKGRDALQAGGHAYAPGNRVFGAIDDCPGVVTAVDFAAGTVTVQCDVKFPVDYPYNTVTIRRAWPWET